MRVEIPGPPHDSTIAAALFDFDETIIDLEAQHGAATDALCREMHSDSAQIPDSMLVSGRRIIDELRDIRAHFGWSASEEELFALRQRLFMEVCRTAELEPMPGVREMIQALRERGISLAVTSSAVHEAIETVLVRLGLRDAFAVIVDGAQVQRGKPDPEAFLVTAKKLGVAPAECIVFEDSELGVVAAKHAGMYCVAVRNPRARTRQDLSAADVVVDSMLSFVR